MKQNWSFLVVKPVPAQPSAEHSSVLSTYSRLRSSLKGFSPQLTIVLCAAVAALGQTAAGPSQPVKKPPVDVLQQKLDAQRAATRMGDPATIVDASRRLTAEALREMARLESMRAQWGPAAAAYRQSLDLEESPSVRVELAAADLNAGHLDDALEESEKVLITDPNNARAWRVKGQILMAREDYRGAADALAHSLDVERDVNAEYALAVCFLRQKDKTKAQTVFQDMLRVYGDKAIWHVVFGGAYHDTDNLDDAVREFKRALEMDPDSPHVHFFLGLTYLQQNYWGPSPQIMQEYQEEIRRYPDDYFGNYGEGVLEALDGELPQSNQHLLAASKAQPDNPDPWLYLGLNAFKQQQNDKAKEYLEKTISLTGKDVSRNNYQIRRAYISMGRILLSEGKKQEAEVYMQKAKDMGAKSMELSSEVITAAMAESGMKSAPGVMPKVSASDGDSTASAGARGAENGQAQASASRLTPTQVRETEAREKQLRAVLSSGFNDWGTAEARQRNYALALSYFQEAEKWDASTPGLMNNLALASLKVGDSKEAARALEAVLKKDPQDQSARSMLPMALFTSGQFSEAAKAFAALGDAAYRDPRMAYAWAFSLTRSNDPQKANEVLGRLASQPLPADMLLAIGDLYTSTGDYEDALRMARRAVELDPSVPRAHYYAGIALIHLDRMNDALAELQTQVKLTPDDAEAQYHLGYALLETSHRDEAIVVLRGVTTEHPDHPQAQYQLGKALLEAGQYQEAITHLEAAARLDPQRDYIHYQLQSAYRKAGRTSDAEKELKLYSEIKEQNRQTANPQPKQ